jgi:hypothetical protein
MTVIHRLIFADQTLQVLMPWHMQQPSQPARGPLRGAKRWRCSGEDPGNLSILWENVGKYWETMGNDPKIHGKIIYKSIRLRLNNILYS